MSNYTQDWFSGNIPRFKKHLQHLKDKENLNFLEIGSFEGRSTTWLLQNILTHETSKITCIDSFNGGYEHSKLNLNSLYDIFLSNIEPYKDKVQIERGLSSDCLLRESVRNKKYNFLYIDGCHESKETLEDAVLSWELMDKDAIIIFDDYLWGNGFKNPTITPKISVESFINCYQKYIEVLEINYQVIIKKK